MNVDLTAPTPLTYFAALVHSDDGFPLLEAAASVALTEYPELDVQQVLADVDRMVARLKRRVAPDMSAIDRVRALGQYFFGTLGFAGNVNDYHNPDNSCLNVVLHTRRGIPISLAVLWLELAQSLDLNVDGVGFPGHFLVQVNLSEGRVVIDPFTGQSLSSGDLRDRIDELYPHHSFPPDSPLPLALHLHASRPRQIVARMLRNLQSIHQTQDDWPRLVAVQDRLIILLPEAWEEYRDRGLALAELGDRDRAASDLAVYLQNAAEADDHDAIAERLASLRG